jgi:hypothetical protein
MISPQKKHPQPHGGKILSSNPLAFTEKMTRSPSFKSQGIADTKDFFYNLRQFGFNGI